MYLGKALPGKVRDLAHLLCSFETDTPQCMHVAWLMLYLRIL